MLYLLNEFKTAIGKDLSGRWIIVIILWQKSWGRVDEDMQSGWNESKRDDKSEEMNKVKEDRVKVDNGERATGTRLLVSEVTSERGASETEIGRGTHDWCWNKEEEEGSERGYKSTRITGLGVQVQHRLRCRCIRVLTRARRDISTPSWQVHCYLLPSSMLHKVAKAPLFNTSLTISSNSSKIFQDTLANRRREQ